MNPKLEPLQPHALAKPFPRLTEPELKDLAADIKANGQKHSIITFEDAVLDGVNRQEACLMAGVEPTYTPFQGDYAAAVKFVVSANIQRRHLTPSQRAMLVAKLETMTHGGNRKDKKDQDAASRQGRRFRADRCQRRHRHEARHA
jgi:ParB-like chromosome segregation protein Spo0J